MERKYRIPMAVATVLILGVLATNSVEAASSIQRALVLANVASLPVKAAEPLIPKSVEEIRASPLSWSRPMSQAALSLSTSEEPAPEEMPDEAEELRKAVPSDYEEAEAQVRPLTNRFLMWTHDLEHIMWGYYRNGFFVGTDNLGKRSWGIYGNGFFAGFYDGEFFWGKYNNGIWKAVDLFGEKLTHGRFVVYPRAAVQATAPTNLP